MAHWLRGFLNRIPRPAFEVCLFWGNGDIQPGFIVFTQEECDSAIAAYNEDVVNGGSIACFRKKWISPAKVEKLPEFQGF
jgi:hypothetical protein